MRERRVRAACSTAVACAIAWTSAACAPTAKKSAHDVADASDYSTDDPTDPPLPPPRPPDYNNPDSGALGAGERERDGAAPEGSVRASGDDAGVVATDAGLLDDGGAGMCPGTLAAGDLAIVEFMIQTQAGIGDRGEWVEIQSTRDCTLNLRGLRVESPRGTGAPDAVDVQDDLFLAPNDTFIVADSAFSQDNHGLQGTVLSWIATDALKNDGDTITASVGGNVIDTITYGDFGASTHLGRSVSFPVDCTWSDRSDWARWSWSFNVYWSAAPGGVSLKGTPNANNDDVACY
jgi:hypothetical protein